MSKAATAGTTVFVSSEYIWQVGDQENTFFRKLGEKYEYWRFAHRMLGDIQLLPAYDRAKELVLADDVWGYQVDKLIGCAMVRNLASLKGILLGIPTYSLSKTHSVDFAEKYFVERVEMLEQYFQSSSIEVIRIAPLCGVTISNKISLTDQLSLETITNDQVIELLNVGIISSQQTGQFGDVVHNVPRVAVINRFRLPKVVGETERTESDSKSLGDLWNRQSMDETLVVDLLTLVMEEVVRPLGSLTKPDNLTGTINQIQKNDITNAWAIQPHMVSEDAEQKLVHLWPILNENIKESRHFLAIAVRRFSQAMTRPSLDDKIIDLMICAEALFLRTEHSELTHQLAYRAALLLGENSAKKKELYKFFREAYAMRSKVVHGAKSYTRDSKDIEQLSTTATKLAELLRRATLKMLTLAVDPQAPKELIDWSDLMFPASPVS